MLFLMLVCRDNAPVQAPSAPAGGDVEQWVTTMDGRGARVTGDALAPDTDAVAVRVRQGQPQVTEGAFLDTKGALLGFDVLDCPGPGRGGPSRICPSARQALRARNPPCLR